jgi:MFS family permease
VGRGLYYGWMLLVVLGVVTIVAYGTTQYLFGVLVVPVGAELGGARAALSTAYSGGLVVSALLGLPVGRIVDRHGARGVFMAGSTIGAISLLALSRATDLTTFAVIWALGLGLAMTLTLYPVSFVLVANWFHRRRGSAMALLTTIGGFSSPIYIPVAGWLIAAHGWRTALTVMAGTQLAMLPLQAIAVRRRPEDMGLAPDGHTPDSPHAATAAPTSGATLHQAIQRRAFWLLTVAGAAGLLSVSALQVHQVPYMIARGVGPVIAASIAGLIGLASVPGRFLLNLLSQRVAPQRLMALALIAMAAGAAILALGGTTPAFVAYALVYGIGFGSVNALRATVMAEHFGRRAYGAITATQNIAVTLCAALGPILAGRLYDAAHDYRPALLAITAALLAATAATLFTPRP